MTDQAQGAFDYSEPAEPDDANDSPRDMLIKLRNLQLFSQLSGEQFELVAGLLRSQNVPQGVVLFEQESLNTNLYILRRGRGIVRFVDAQDVEHREGILRGGSIFNLTAFLSGARTERSVEASDPLILWYITREDFTRLLVQYPDVAEKLILPQTTGFKKPRLKLLVPRYSWQRPNENVVLFKKKHPWVYVSSILPILMLAVILAVLLFLALRTLAPPILLPVLLLLGLLVSLYVVYQYIDWQNDYYAVTDQRVLHRERVLLIRDEQEEVPLSKIQDIQLSRPGFLSMVIDLGDVTIEASGIRSRVRFESIQHPEAVADSIWNQREAVQSESNSARRTKFRAELRSELDLGPKMTLSSAAIPSYRKKLAASKPLSAPLKKPASSWRMLRNTLMPRMRLEQGDQIIFRKHWLQLLRTIAMPAIVSLAYTIGLVVVRLASPDLSDVLFRYPISLVVLAVGLGLYIWWIYQYEDWRNDIYILTSDRIIDIDRSPFGLRGTQRREAKLNAVQNVTSSTRGILDSAFNVGDVTIMTAGSEGHLTFERVYDPRHIQRDINDRLEVYASGVREKESSLRRREMTEWLGIYDEMTRLHDREKLG